MRLYRWLAGGFLASGSLLGCGFVSELYACAHDDQCTVDGREGTCQADGNCSFADPACDSGIRYGELSASALAGQCVPLDGNPDEGSDSDIDSVPPAGGSPSTTSSTTDGSSSTTDGSSSTTDGSSSTTDGSSSTTDGSSSTTEDSTEEECVALEDEFDSVDVDSMWEPSESAQVQQDDGILLIRAEPPYRSASVLANDVFELSGGPVTVEFGSLPEGYQEEAFVRVAPPPADGPAGDWFEFGFFAATTERARLQVYRLRDGGTNPLLVHAVTAFSFDEPYWLRVRPSDGRLAFEFSTDGDAFELFTVVDSTEFPDVGWSVALEARMGSYTSGVEASFRSFAVACEPSTASEQ